MSNNMKNYSHWCGVAYDKVIELGYEPLVVNLYGSQNYGMETENSDFDFKAIVLPSVDDVIYNHCPISTSIAFNGGLIDIKDIRLMWDNYKKQNPNFIETLFTPSFCANPKYANDWFDMRDLAEDIAKADVVRAVKAFYGMILQKRTALTHAYPSKVDIIEKYGYDAKQLCHIVRLYYMLESFENCKSYNDLLRLDYSETIVNILKEIKTYEIKLTAREAIKVADDYMEKAKNIVDDIVSRASNFPVNEEVYKQMDMIKARIIKTYFKNSL